MCFGESESSIDRFDFIWGQPPHLNVGVHFQDCAAFCLGMGSTRFALTGELHF
jgi:hypothetical protein